MRFGWVSVGAVAGLMTLAACGRDAAVEGPAVNAEAVRASEAFLQRNARQEGVVVLPSGLQYQIVTSGPEGGVRPDRNDLVRVDYEGTLIDGTVFDSTIGRGLLPSVMSPDQAIPGWTEALQLMRPGDEWMIYVPSDLAYGDDGRPPTIPGGSALIFRLRLLDVAPTPGGGSGVGMAMG